MAMKRIRVELGDNAYEALRYFGMLRGHSLGTVLRVHLTMYADAVMQEFPAVKAHVRARHEAMIAAETVAPTYPSEDPDDYTY